LRLDAAMADKMKDVPILFQQLLHQILSGSAGNPLENHPSFALKLVDALVDAFTLPGDLQSRPFLGVRSGDHSQNTKRTSDAHRCRSPCCLQIPDERQPKADVTYDFVFLVQIFPWQRREIGRAYP